MYIDRRGMRTRGLGPRRRGSAARARRDVIDYVGSSFTHLDPDYRGRTIEAEPLAEGVLERAGIAQAEALAAVTNSDAVNAVVAHVARTVFNVPNVVSRNYDPRWRPLHEAMGLRRGQHHGLGRAADRGTAREPPAAAGVLGGQRRDRAVRARRPGATWQRPGAVGARSAGSRLHGRRASPTPGARRLPARGRRGCTPATSCTSARRLEGAAIAARRGSDGEA